MLSHPVDDADHIDQHHEQAVQKAIEEQEEAEQEDASLWAHFDHWVWDDALLKQLP